MPRHQAPALRGLHPRRILVVKPCCLGDVLMATPAIRALHTAFPTALLDVLVTAWAAPALDGNPRIRRLIRYPDPATPVAVVRLGFKLRRERYDIGICLDRSPLANALLWVAGIPIRAGIDSQRRGVRLTHRVHPRSDQHETELYLAVLEQLGVTPQGVAPEYAVAPAARESARRWLASLLPSQRTSTLVVVHPGGGVNPGTRMPAKRWPPERYAGLIDRLVETGVTVILTGSESDLEAVEAVKRHTRQPVHDLCGRLTIPELAALCAEAQLFVGNDTGASHLAAAVGIPTVTVFGPTSPVQYRPLGPLSLVCAPEESWRTPTGIDLRRHRQLDRVPGVGQVSIDEVYHACRLVLERAVSRWS